MEVKDVVEKVHGDEDLKTEIHEALSRTEALPDLDVSTIDGIAGEVVSKFFLLARKQVLSRFGKTPKSLRLKEVELKTKPGDARATYYLVRPQEECYLVLRICRSFGVHAKKRKLAANTSVFPRQGELLFATHGDEFLRAASLLNLDRVATFDMLDQRVKKPTRSNEDGAGRDDSVGADDSDGVANDMGDDVAYDGSADTDTDEDGSQIDTMPRATRGVHRKVSSASASAIASGPVENSVDQSVADEDSASWTMKPSAARPAAPKASPLKGVPLSVARASPTMEPPKKGTPDYWIFKSNLDDIADGLIKTGHRESQIEILLPKLSDTDRRRLSAHWTHMKDAKLMKEGQMHTLERGDLVAKALSLSQGGLSWRPGLKARDRSCFLDFDMKTFEDVEQPMEARRAALKSALRIMCPFPTGSVSEWSPKCPLLSASGLDDGTCAIMVQRGFFESRVPAWLGMEERGELCLSLLSDAMQSEYVLGEDTVIGKLSTYALNHGKRVLQVLQVAADPQIRAGTNPRIYDDAEELQAAGKKTSSKPGIWEVVGHAIHDYPKWANALSEFVADKSNLKKLAPELSKAYAELDALPEQPTAETAKKLSHWLGQLSSFHVRAKGSADEFEHRLVSVALESARSAIDALNEMKVKHSGDFNEEMLGSYMDTLRSVVENCVDVHGADVLLRELMELKRSLDEEARGSMLLASLERFQLGDPTLAKTLAAELDMAKGNHLEEQVRVAALGLWEKVVAQEKLLQLCGDDLKEDICLLRALAKVVPADAETECQNVVAMLQPLILLGQSATTLNALGATPKEIAEHVRVVEHLTKIERDHQRCLAMTSTKFVWHGALLDVARATCAEASKLQQAVGQILCGTATSTLVHQVTTVANDVEKETSILAWRSLLANEQDWGKCVDGAKETILSWSAGAAEKQAVELKTAAPYKRIAMSSNIGHVQVVLSSRTV